jgi:hypothetical protein
LCCEDSTWREPRRRGQNKTEEENEAVEVTPEWSEVARRREEENGEKKENSKKRTKSVSELMNTLF